MKEKDFDKRFNQALVDNAIAEKDATPKTVNNIRTEMSSLFGLVRYENGYAAPSRRVEELARTGDGTSFFKSFCNLFQWPGGFNKIYVVKEHVQRGVRLKPAKFILSVLKNAIESDEERYLTSAEVAHMIFNDARVSIDRDGPIECWKRIEKHRKLGITYSTQGKLIRYGRDFLHFMQEAKLLREKDRRFFMNANNAEPIDFIISTTTFFNDFHQAMDSHGAIDEDALHEAMKSWVTYFSSLEGKPEFRTAIEDVLDISRGQIEIEVSSKTRPVAPPRKKRKGPAFVSAAALRKASKKKATIGEIGEMIVEAYEKEELRKLGQKALASKVKRVSENAALGYDVLSFARDGKEKFIEVKTTSYPRVSPFILSAPEWNTALELKSSYWIYRVYLLAKKKIKIEVFQNPGKLEKEGKLRLEPREYWVYYA